ncbi:MULTISPECIES: hypothetical protein [unclassified Natrinema]|uniref:hypothetical protein n=1 Tax=unclassified Natrinema TaxID=2622230 RepID=UPI00026D4851|nr:MULTISPECIES: hypothetical protein [unclassified Natrinema]AFO57012.1 hypothetical protein NJ7G_1770 [Natrinema sp. J7-2]
MSGNNSGIDRRSVLRKTGIGLASVSGVAMAAGSASATDLSVGDKIEYTPSGDKCYHLMENPPNGNWDRTGPYACPGWETEVLEIYVYDSSGEQFVKVDFGQGPGWESEHAVEKI